ncbi:DNA-directed RNA polymerase II 15.1 kDa polypeptide-related protein [Trichomonas vaginalis G3]|uniref:DNA-directed RNA polymerase II 15.1 kDa polypeptide-related protein n=1 Tax=Trichomonas vaginalis (strain ATCC PRA-98 / G3) TaxID=412133 RepID=A2E2P5_TRIV3|nr:DNA-directed RNA polymerase [Trichomonas vaginalis G3]EAY13073.1 DNA-directed RNA polymerase II 15.1 kDa polypeptide-related protein [Trichomonas vaginalis G3]KAI5548261.1 DNA-directed RNA polymerase [Trichomonas vaginalis G3]|eukprot:XP_001325296.1 DNA-directed RNA polymerase II 15.1 kDa polypeptide-related protein [Trichomonas vaginalis G3]
MEFDEETTATQLPGFQKENRTGAKVYFCSECQSVLTPRVFKKENGEAGKLEFYCAQCNRSEYFDDNLVYVNILKRDASSVSATKVLTSDPTLHRWTVFCNNCRKYEEHVIFNAPTLAGEETMTQLKQCCVCSVQTPVTEDDRRNQMRPSN